MRIAVSFKNGNVYEHVGDTEAFKVYEVKDEKIVNTELYKVKGTGRSMVVDFATQYQIDVMICGRICDGAKGALEQSGVTTYGCMTGNADDVVKAYLDGSIEDCGTSVCEHN